MGDGDGDDGPSMGGYDDGGGEMGYWGGSTSASVAADDEFNGEERRGEGESIQGIFLGMEKGSLVISGVFWRGW